MLSTLTGQHYHEHLIPNSYNDATVTIDVAKVVARRVGKLCPQTVWDAWSNVCNDREDAVLWGVHTCVFNAGRLHLWYIHVTQHDTYMGCLWSSSCYTAWHLWHCILMQPQPASPSLVIPVPQPWKMPLCTCTLTWQQLMFCNDWGRVARCQHCSYVAQLLLERQACMGEGRPITNKFGDSLWSLLSYIQVMYHVTQLLYIFKHQSYVVL